MKPLKLFSLILSKSRGIVVLSIVIGVISGASATALIALIHHVLSREEFSSPIWIWRFVGLAFIATISGIGAQLLLLRLSQNSIAELRMDLSRKVLQSPLRHLEELGSSRLLAALTDDVTTIALSLVLVPRIVINVTTLVGGTLYMAWLSWSALLIVFGPIALGALIYRLVIRRAMNALRNAREEHDALFSHLRALTDGIKELKLHWKRRNAFLYEELQPTVESFRDLHIVGRTFFIVSENLTRLLFFALFGMLIFVLPRLKGVNNEVLTGYVLTTLYLFRPLGVIMYLLPSLGQAAVALQKVEDLGLSLVDHTTEVYLTEPPLASPVWARIEVAGVTHTYHREKEDSHFTLGPIDHVFRPGELVFLVGGNGSGKTTLAKIITGLYPPEAGEIRLDGEPITDKNRDNFRQFFSTVFADFYLFESLLGLSDVTLDDQARDYLLQLQLNHKVKVHDGMLSTTDLSRGQRKRLALLTAYLEDRPFYVFDEWASDQDPLFKKIFYTQLLPELKAKGKTILVISHDDRYFHIADRCIKLEDGQLQDD